MAEFAHPGLAVLTAKGCLDCHSVDGKPMVGPTLKGLFGKQEVVVRGKAARAVTVDEARLREAIVDPMKDVVRGYPPSMPETPLAPKELEDVIAYLKTLK